MANIITIEAVDCVRKYFVAASVARGFLGVVIIGMIANVLISNPIQAVNQCSLKIVRQVPIKRLSVKIVVT